MIRINEIEISLEQIAKGNTLILVDIAPYKEYVDGKATDKTMGYRYTCVCPDNKFEKITIKVEESKPLLSSEEIALTGTIKVSPLGFEGRFYRDKNGEYILSAKAKEIKEVE